MDLRVKSILVTGGTGFIGAALVNKLISEGCHVNIISLPKDPIWRIDDISKCKLYEADLRNPSEAEKTIKKIQPEIIFNLAGIIDTQLTKETINQVFSINLDATRNLLIALSEYDYDLFIHTGTGNEYGNMKPPFNETDRENPISPYSASKIATTYFCEMMARVYEKPIITVRPFLIYGPKQISRSLIPSLIYSGIQDKKLSLTPCEQTRDFIFIEDVVDAIISLANNSKKIKNLGIFNVGSGKETKILEVIELIRKKLKSANFLIGDKPYRPGETMRHYSSIDKIKKVINWVPKWSLEDGINITIDWWLNNKNIWIKYKQIWV